MSRVPGAFARQPLVRPVYIISFIIVIFLLWHFHGSSYSFSHLTTAAPSGHVDTSSDDVGTILGDAGTSCRQFPETDSIVTVMRTGSTELAAKLPVHISTTLKCFQHYLIFSDHEEHFHGEHILDALESVSPHIQAEHADFDLWRRLKSGGRESLQQSELSGPDNRPHGGLGKDDNPGWKLDKWKFLPMVNRTWAEYPDKKWYLFLEPDTFIFTQSLLAQLKVLDWHEPYYLGSEMQIGEVLFAHGGSGFIVSQPAMRAVVELFNENQDEWEKFTDGHWAGDCVLGKAFLDSGTPLVWANPIWQGMPIGEMDWRKPGLLCRPAVTYHHMSPSVVEDMWKFEQQWTTDKNDHSSFLRHVDVLADYILPRTRNVRYDWDNHSGDDQGAVDSLEACQSKCEKSSSCVQYSLKDSRCMTTSSPNLGHVASGITSGWIYDRMERLVKEAPKCSSGGWITLTSRET